MINGNETARAVPSIRHVGNRLRRIIWAWLANGQHRNAGRLSTYAAQIVAAFGAIGSVAVLSRILTTSDYGTYAAIVAVVALANALIGTAIGTSALAASVAGKGLGPVRVSPIAAVAASLIVVIATAPTAAYLGAAPLAIVCVCLLGLILVSAEIAQGVMLGRRRFGQYLAATSLRAVITVVALLPLLWLPYRFRLSAAFGVAALASLGFSLFASRSLRIGIGRSLGVQSTLTAVGVANLGLWVLATGDRIVLAGRAGPSTVAVYAVLYGITDRVVRSLANGHIAIWFPWAFTTPADSRRARGLRHIKSYLAALSVSVIALALSSSLLVRALTGGRFSATIMLGAVLALGVGLLGLAAPAYVLLVSSGRGRIVALAACAAAAINIGGNWVVDPRWGATGAAFMTVVGYGVYTVVLIGAYRRLLRVVSTPRAIRDGRPAIALDS
jgi:O-antigen/teichoic acid export membrane protein